MNYTVLHFFRLKIPRNDCNCKSGGPLLITIGKKILQSFCNSKNINNFEFQSTLKYIN